MLIVWDILHMRHRLETLRYSIRLTQIRSIEVFITLAQTWDSEFSGMCDTDLRLWDILHIWHRLQNLRYSLRLTQYSRSEIFTRGWHRSWGLRYSTQKTQILRPEILSMADTDPKTWYIQHMRHRSQNLRYSTLKTTLKLWDIQQKDTDLKTWDIQNGRCRYLFWKVKKKLRNCNRITIKTNFKLRKDSVNLNVAFTSIKSLGSIPSFNK